MRNLTRNLALHSLPLLCTRVNLTKSIFDSESLALTGSMELKNRNEKMLSFAELSLKLADRRATRTSDARAAALADRLRHGSLHFRDNLTWWKPCSEKL